jgi:hypothetical protein
LLISAPTCLRISCHSAALATVAAEAERLPEAISYEQSTNSFRLFPLPASGVTPNRYIIAGDYKKNPPVLAASTWPTATDN